MENNYLPTKSHVELEDNSKRMIIQAETYNQHKEMSLLNYIHHPQDQMDKNLILEREEDQNIQFELSNP